MPRTESSRSFGYGYAERCEAVQHGDTDVELGNLTVEISSGQTLAQQFDTMHLGFDAAPAVISAPSSPDSSTEAFRRAKRLVARNRPRAIGLPGFGVFAGWYDGRSAASGDGIMALASVEGTISGDTADLLIGRDLVEKFGQHGRVSDIAGGELRSPDFECFLVNSDVDLTPDTAFGATVLARVPFTFALDPDACAVAPAGATGRIKAFCSYTLQEASEVTGVSTRALRTWIANGQPAMDGARPVLVRGDDLITYIKRQRKGRRSKLALDRFYCLRCRAPCKAADGLVECQTSGNRLTLVAICDTCETILRKPVARANLPKLRALFDLVDCD